MKKQIKRKIWCIILLVPIFFLAILVLMNRYIIVGQSPEEVYQKVYNSASILVVEGEESALVIGKDDSVYMKRTEKGWKIPIQYIAISKSFKILDTATVNVKQLNFSEDYYISVLSRGKSELDVTDNYNSIFYQLGENEVYHAYVNQIKDDYVITINGEEIRMFE